MVTCCHDVGTYKNPKIPDQFHLDDIKILKKDCTMLESFNQSTIDTNNKDTNFGDIFSDNTLLPAIHDDTIN